MNFGDYDQYIIQKYRLAVAMAVLKTKPKNIPIEEYLNQIKEKINDTNVAGDDITICEEDFNFDDNDSVLNDDVANNNLNDSNDSVTILKDFDFNDLVDNRKEINVSLLDVMQMLKKIDEDPVNKTAINISTNTQSNNFELQNDETNFVTDIISNIDQDMTFCEDLSQNTNIPIDDETVFDNFDSQQTELYTLQNFTEYNTHISQSQDNFVVSKNLLINKTKSNCNIDNKKLPLLNNNDDKRKNKLKSVNEEQIKRMKVDLQKKINSTEEPTKSSAQNKNDHNNMNLSLSSNVVNINSIANDKARCINNSEFLDLTFESNSSYFTNINKFDGARKSKEITPKSQNKYSFGEFEYFTQENVIFNNLSHSNSSKVNIDGLVQTQNDKADFDNNAITNDENDNTNARDSETDKSDDLTESQLEIVTFKVLEDLSKVKNYLTRKEKKTSKSDSGYKSLHARNSGGSGSQNSSIWINESAHCLYTFITTCPIIMSTVEITDEISKVLGKLIDNLHEEEIYPSFLEEILENINEKLNIVYEGNPNDDKNILNKDEIIHRIFLINRSMHIIKYSIEKIITIIENTIKNIKDNFEIEYTDKSENICYIFHILEELLKRSNRYKNVPSQNSSQISQEEKILKKSSLTEIWRKKWNLTKDEIFEGSSEKKCVLTKCSDVLNKIIVQAMDGYSLISFAALQCFNLLQK